MYRSIDLTFKPYPAPVGDGEGVIRPNLGYRPEAPILHEPLGSERTPTEILSFYKTTYAMSGVQPGEIFQKCMLTTKPHTTYATFFNPNENDSWAGRYLAELPARDLVGPFTLIEVKPAGGVITAEALKKALGTTKPERRLLVRTGYSKQRPEAASEDYLKNSPVLDEGAANYLAGLGIRVFGTDARCIDPRYSQKADTPVYTILNGAGIVVIDDLTNLDAIKPKHAMLFVGIPLPVRWSIGGPARVFAVDVDKPTDFIDLSHVLDFHPNTHKDHPLPFTLPVSEVAIDEIGDYPNPWPGRIEPREEQGKTQRGVRLTPFRMLDDDGGERGQDMYIEYSHGTGTHIEAAFFDPWGRHGVPDEIFKRYIRMPKDRLVGDAVLIDLSDQVGPMQQIDSRHLKRNDPGLKPGDICVMRSDVTDWSFYGSTPGNTPGLSPDAAMWLVERKIRALVLDFAVEKSDPMPSSPAVKYTPNKIHYFLHKNDIPVIEWCVNMKNLRKKRFVIAICALPASHQGGFPAQVFALEKW
ncbi:MAG TPA: cyclase family protein [Devosiaceae bacterium]|jgi:kynurenine formamidase